MTVAIIEDERDALQLLTHYLSEYPQFRLIGTAEDGPAAVELINRLKPELIFLDVQLPGFDGFEVIRRLEELPLLVFSTAYDQYAIRAFELHATDYLLKPYGRKRLRNTVDRLLSRRQADDLPLAQSLLQPAEGFPERVILQKGKLKVFVNVSEISYLEAYGDYCLVHTPETHYLSAVGISKLLELLDPRSFIRVHRKYVVQLQHLKEFRRIGRYPHLILKHGASVRVSDSYLPEIRKLRW